MVGKNEDIDNKAIGKRIREEREKLGLARDEFAEVLGLSSYYVGQLERGERQMSLPALVKVSGCLHISIDYLVFGDTNHDDYETNSAEIKKLLNKCSPKELNLLSKLIKTLLPYLNK
ncbi:MAG: helix-turn-helix domain-containing protein [Syntrophomonadaceae bacterium]|jgi:transcriptional regulator with XRE-family HTH domain